MKKELKKREMRNNWFKMFMYSGAHFEDSLEKEESKLKVKHKQKIPLFTL